MRRSKFYKFFPPPHYLTMPSVGMDVSDAALRFVELMEKNGEIRIGRYGERSIPRGVIEQGEVRKPAEFRAILIDLRKQYDLEFVVVTLPEEKAYFFDLELPALKAGEVRGAIELAMEEHVPFKASEMLFDYDIEEATDTVTRVNVSAVPRTLVDNYLEAFAETGIIPIAFEVEAQSVARSVIPAGARHAAMIVDLGKTRTGVTIVVRGTVAFTSTIPIGGDTLTAAIAKNLSLSFDDAERMKREQGIIGASEDKVSSALLPIVSAVRGEIRKSYSYWQTHTDNYGKRRADITAVYLCGGDANMPGLAERLAFDPGVSIVLANVFTNVNSLTAYIPEISFSDSLRYATAIGLALKYQ